MLTLDEPYKGDDQRDERSKTLGALLLGAGFSRQANLIASVTAAKVHASGDLRIRFRLVGVQAHRTRQLLPFASMVTSPAVILMVTVPVVVRSTVLMVVVPLTSRTAAVVACIMPFAVTSMMLVPLAMFPIAMPVIVSITMPARTNENSGRRLDVHLRGRSVDRLRRIDNTGDSDVYSNIDVCEGEGRYAYAETGNQCHDEPAVAEDAHSLVWLFRYV